MRIGSTPMKKRWDSAKTMNSYPSIWQSGISALVFLSLMQSAFSELADSRKRQLMQLVEEPHYDCKYLSLEEKEFLKGYFYEVIKRTNNPTACDYQLLQIGDEATIQRYVREFRATGIIASGATPSASGQACFIEVFAPVIFRDEPLVYSGGDTPGLPQSYGMTASIIRLLRESPQLSPEVRHWALSLNERELEKNRALLQKWWRANERHFRERNYQAAQPPPVTTTPPSPADTRPPSLNPPQSATPPPTAAGEPGAAAENSSFIAGFVTALCATLLALAYWLNARQKRPLS